MKHSLGIDIGSCYTKVVHLELKPALKLINYFFFKTPFIAPCQVGQNPIDIKNFWGEITSRIPQETIRSSQIGINLPSGSITVMMSLLPRMPKNELNLASQNEAKRKMIPASGPNHIFENAIINTRIIAHSPRYEVITARSEVTQVKQILELFTHIRTRPSLITFCGSTLFSLLSKEMISKKDVDAAFIDIGARSINVSILREGKLCFFRSTAFGLTDAFRGIAKNLSLAESKAEEITQEKGIPEVDCDLKNKVVVAEEIMRQKYEAGLQSAASQKEEVAPLELRAVWQPHIDRISQELRRSLIFYKEQSEGRRVENFYFLGAGAQIKNLACIVMQQFGGQWQIAHPFTNMRSEKLIVDAPSTAIFYNAASLALSLTRKEKGISIIDFLPQKLKINKLRAKMRAGVFILTLGLILFLALFSIAAGMHNNGLTLKIKKAEKDLNQTRNISRAFKELELQDKRIKQKTALLEELLNQRTDLSLPLISLAKAIPKEIWLTHLSIASNTASVAPASMPAEEDPSLSNTFTQGRRDSSLGANTKALSLEINAEMFNDYETAHRLTEGLRANLEKIPQFKNIRITPLKLETLSPTISGQELSLTQSQLRKITITIDLSSNAP